MMMIRNSTTIGDRDGRAGNLLALHYPTLVLLHFCCRVLLDFCFAAPLLSVTLLESSLKEKSCIISHWQTHGPMVVGESVDSVKCVQNLPLQCFNSFVNRRRCSIAAGVTPLHFTSSPQFHQIKQTYVTDYLRWVYCCTSTLANLFLSLYCCATHKAALK